jgi:molecular chaperone DnaJ
MRKEWMEKDYYADLGVSKDTSDKEIKKAFRKLARTFHPDNNPDDAAAEARFKEINEAYETLSDTEERKEYDHVREMGYFVGGPGGNQEYVRVEDLFGGGGAGQPFGGTAGGSSIDDLLGGLFGGGRGRQPRAPQPMRGRDIDGDLSLTFHEALSGVTKDVHIQGRAIKVKVPMGISDGTRIRLKGRGGPGQAGGPTGDAYVTVHVAEHPIFKRKDKRDLEIEVPITFGEAALGAVVEVPTLDGSTKIRITPGTPSGKTLRVKGKGVETAHGHGDLYVTVDITVPAALSDEERTLLEEFAAMSPNPNPRAHLGV